METERKKNERKKKERKKKKRKKKSVIALLILDIRINSLVINFKKCAEFINDRFFLLQKTMKVSNICIFTIKLRKISPPRIQPTTSTTKKTTKFFKEFVTNVSK